MTTTDAAQLLAVSQRTIQRWCHSGIINAAQVPSRRGRLPWQWHITPAALLSALRDGRHSHMREVVGKVRVRRAMDVLNRRKDGG